MHKAYGNTSAKDLGIVRQQSPRWNEPVHVVLIEPHDKLARKRPKQNHQSLGIRESPLDSVWLNGGS